MTAALEFTNSWTCKASTIRSNSAASTPRRFFQAHSDDLCPSPEAASNKTRRRVFFVWEFGAAESRTLEK